MRDPVRGGMSRRGFLAGGGALAGAALLAACGGGDDSGASGASGGGTQSTTGTYVLAQFFGGGQFAAGAPVRAPFSVADQEGLLLPAQAPATIEVEVLGPDGTRLGRPSTLRKRAAGLPRPYYAVEFTPPAPGIYTARATSGKAAGNAMSIEVSDPKDLHLIRPGLVLPALQTPTTANAQGVTPICTRTPVCPLHDVTLAQALTEPKPVALVISTPGYCQVAICGPVLELVLDAVATHPGIRFLHAEVYLDPTTSTEKLAPTLDALGLSFEPVLVLAKPDGTVVDRVDSIWDTDELGDALTGLAKAV